MLIAFRLYDSQAQLNLGNLVPSPTRPGYHNILLSPTILFSMGDRGELNNVPLAQGDGVHEQFKRNGTNIGAFFLPGNIVQRIELFEL